MDKHFILDRIKKKTYTEQDLVGWINALPNSTSKRNPTIAKVGDTYMHPIFHHPYVLIENKKTHWICCLITTEETCTEILEICNSRFFEGYITKVMFTVTEPVGSFINVYENNSQLKSIIKKLREIFK